MNGTLNGRNKLNILGDHKVPLQMILDQDQLRSNKHCTSLRHIPKKVFVFQTLVFFEHQFD